MAQIFRMYKLEIPIIIRHYGSYNHPQRAKDNYYNTLHVSTDATQKEIKDAFIKLSKKVHPDCGNEGSHLEFVKINEAYSVLSKTASKRDYDMSLKYNFSYTGSTNVSHSGKQRGSRATYADWGFMDPSQHPYYKPNQQDVKLAVLGCVLLIVLGSLIQVLVIQKATKFKRQYLLERDAKFQADYERLKVVGKDKILEEKLQRLSDYHENLKFRFRND